MRPAKVGAEAVGDALVSAFRASGYAGASLRDLCEASGLKSASLYDRFPSGKGDMALAALGRAGEAFGPAVLEPLARPGDPAERLRESAEGVARFYDDGRLACLLAVMALSDAPQAVRAAVAAMFDRWTGDLAAVLAEAARAEPTPDPALHRAPDPRAEAQDRIAGVQGALILARAGAGKGAGKGAGREAGTDAFARAIERLARP